MKSAAYLFRINGENVIIGVCDLCCDAWGPVGDRTGGLKPGMCRERLPSHAWPLTNQTVHACMRSGHPGASGEGAQLTAGGGKGPGGASGGCTISAGCCTGAGAGG